MKAKPTVKHFRRPDPRNPVQEKLNAVKCPVHQKPAKFDNGKIDCCCEELERLVDDLFNK